MSLSKRLRYEILNRDGHTCRYCGGQPPNVVLTVDHVLPTALGGSDDPSNLCAACKDCNAGKSSMTPGAPMVAQVDADAFRWARAIEYVASARALKIEELEADIREFDAEWDRWTGNGNDLPIPRTPDWRGTVEIWLKRGMTVEMLRHYVPKAMAAQVRFDSLWRYYCGIIWKVITELDEAAKALLQDQAFLEVENLGPDRDLLKALIF